MPDASREKRLRAPALALATAVAIGAAAAWWVIDRAGFVITSDARVRARMVAVSSEVAGRILALPVEAGDYVKTGQVLAQLDDSEAKLALSAASLDLKALEAQIEREKLRASLARTRGSNRVDSHVSSLAGARADASAAQVLLEAAEADQARALKLHASGLVTQAAMDRANATLEAARQGLARAQAAVNEGRAGVGEAKADAGEAGVIEGSIEALSLQAHALRQRVLLLEVELEQHAIASPLVGVIDEVFVEPGEHLAPGARIALAHAPEGAWIEANIKETELAGVRAGARVEIQLDASFRGCTGAVVRVGEAAVSEFSLIPGANPTGVFTKITQRVPVRIEIGADCTGVRPGAMATLKIRTQ